MPDSTYMGRLNASRLLAFSGLVMVASGLMLGELYAIFISHVANGVIKQSWSAVVSAVASGDMSVVVESFRNIEELTVKRGRIMNTHSHLTAYGLVAFLFSFLQPGLGTTRSARSQLAVMFIAGAVLHSGGVYLSYYFGIWLAYAADIGAGLAIIAIAGLLLALWRSPADTQTNKVEQLRAQLSNPASRHLIKSGLLLIFLGMAFGLFVAGRLVTQDEPLMYGAMSEVFSSLGQQNVEAAQSHVTAFKGAQSRSAITAAAHSHAIEFGFLLLLLAFVQRWVFLPDHWRQRWCRLSSIGAYLLPASVFMATLVGMPAAAMADFSGSLVLISLLAMMVGMIRFTGAADLQANDGGRLS